MILLTLPWPPRTLSPNSRPHWSRLAKAKRLYRYACFIATKEAMAPRFDPVPDGPLLVELQFCPPDHRSRDIDNMLASCKAALDGVASALKVNDKHFRLAAQQMGAVVKDGAVYVRLSEATPPSLA